MKPNSMFIISNRRRIRLLPEDILYVQLAGRRSVIHLSGGKTYETYTAIDELAQMLGSGFIRADRATLVSAKGVHSIGKKLELINGETLSYTRRRKRELKEQLRAGRQRIAQSLSNSDAPATREDYQRHYASYDSAPFAFTDIEMVFNEKRAAVDCSMIADMLPSKLELYSLAAPSGSTDAAADDVFSALGFTRDRSYKSAYDSVLLYRSTNAQALLWCYNNATFNFTLYSGGEGDGSDPFELAYKLLDSIGRPLPAGLTREIADDGEYRLTADFLHSGDEIYNGSVNFSVHDGRLEYLDYELYTMLPLGEEYTLSADGVARLIRRGEFICTGGVMISSEIDEVQCRTVNIVYAGDSKNFYRPMYSIEAVINGGVATILLPAF